MSEPLDKATEAFKKRLCREFHVESVNDLPMSDSDYARILDYFQYGWTLCESRIASIQIFGKEPEEYC